MTLENTKICIVVPVYKEFNLLSNQELISLRQLFKVLGGYKIFLVGPEKLQYDSYLREAKKQNVSLKVKRFSNKFFNSIKGYNRLMISADFYNKFKRFKYMLIHQPDAYVFRDELKYWCNKSYDYIGAPWFEGWHLSSSSKIYGVGNGGFSLRSISACIRLLKSLRYAEVLEKYKDYLSKSVMVHLPEIFSQLSAAKKKVSNFERNHDLHEDWFWCVSAPLHLQKFTFNNPVINQLALLLIKSDFKIAPVADAIRFAFEVNPRQLFELNNEQLPFGCHACEKYDPEFWKEHIAIKEPVK